VKGHKGREVYTCLGGHFCSCHAFFYDVVNKANALVCKHLLAAQFARVLQRHRTIYVSDVVFASIAETAAAVPS
jgi:predicted nucleic acid-binding Zn finger protein